MKLPHTRLFNVVTASVITFLGLGGGAAAAHSATVEAALLEASQAAREVQAKRDGLAQSIDRARLATGAANAHLEDESVALAVDQLDSSITAATARAEIHDVVVEIPEAPFLSAEAPSVGVLVGAEGAPDTATPEDVDAEAEPATAVSPAPDASAEPTVSPTRPTLEVESGAALEVGNVRKIETELEATTSVDATVEEAVAQPVDTQVVSNPEVQKVLDGQERDLEVVRQVTAELEQAAIALDKAALEVERVADEVAVATDGAILQEAQGALEGEVEDAQSRLASSTSVLEAVGENVADPATLVSATAAQKQLAAAIDEVVDQSDADALAAHSEKVTSATTRVDSAVEKVRASHAAWVEAENARIDAENEELKEQYRQEREAAQEAAKERFRAAVSANQDGWSGRPDGVTGSNGHVVYSEMTSLPFAPGHQLHDDAAEALIAANAAYRAETGRNLVLTDSYRSYASQVRTRARKGGLAAIPGTSNHGWGMAVDLDAASAAWLTRNGAQYGWVHPTWARKGGSKPEWWHLEFVAPGVADAHMPEEPAYLSHVKNALD